MIKVSVSSHYYYHHHYTTAVGSIFIVLRSPSDRKTVVNLLPKVGIGANYGLPQTRYS